MTSVQIDNYLLLTVTKDEEDNEICLREVEWNHKDFFSLKGFLENKNSDDKFTVCHEERVARAFVKYLKNFAFVIPLTSPAP